MRRRTFDALAVFVGLALTVILIVAGSLLTWAHNFTDSEVRTQLVAQKIYFPAANSAAVKAPEFAPMRQYGGELMTTGAQAEVYADYFIANHLKEIGGGLTYSQLSAKAMAQPNNAKLAGEVATVFKGTTLRGMLLNAYGFWKMGQIAWIAAIAAFASAGLMLLLSLLGLWHLRRTPDEQEVLERISHHRAVPQPV